MSNNASHVHRLPRASLNFNRPVGLHVRSGWVFIETAEQAQACLSEWFTEKTGPSYLRAVATCGAAVSGRMSPDAAQATLIVAAMEAGFAFEIMEEGRVALEREVEAAAAKGLEELFLAEAAE